jgi:hypothetical protein
VTGSLTTIASRERVTIADNGPGGNTPASDQAVRGTPLWLVSATDPMLNVG